MKKFIYVLLFALISVSVLPLVNYSATASENEASDFSILLSVPPKVEPGEAFEITATVTNISYPDFEGGKGIFGAAVFLYYDSEYYSIVNGSFKATVPEKWDSFDGTATPGVWAFYAVFDGLLSNGAVNDGDISFTVSMKANEKAPPQNSHFEINGCECTGYNSKSIVKVKSYNSSAYCDEVVRITVPDVLLPKENCPFSIDTEKGIIYSQSPNIDYNEFTSYFSVSSDNITISAFDYVVNSDNNSLIPNGAAISVYHEQSEKSFTFTYYLLGDCDCNGKITVSDAAVLKAVIITKIPVQNYVIHSMDFEKDGIIRLSDYFRLKKYISSNVLIYK